MGKVESCRRRLLRARNEGPVVVAPQSAVKATTSVPGPTVPFGAPVVIAESGSENENHVVEDGVR